MFPLPEDKKKLPLLESRDVICLQTSGAVLSE